MEEFKRIKTGVPGIDKLLDGGIPSRSLVLLAGSCGTGKTIFGLQFALEGAKNKEPSVFVTLQESAKRLRKIGNIFGWDLKALEEEDKLRIVRPKLYDYDKLQDEVRKNVEQTEAERLVVDSLSVLGSYFRDSFELRRKIMDFNQMLKNFQCTALMTSEMESGKEGISRFGVEEFITDGVIVIYYIKKENTFFRAVTVRKMRGTNHSKDIHPLHISGNGVEVFPEEEIFR